MCLAHYPAIAPTKAIVKPLFVKKHERNYCKYDPERLRHECHKRHGNVPGVDSAARLTASSPPNRLKEDGGSIKLKPRVREFVLDNTDWPLLKIPSGGVNGETRRESAKEDLDNKPFDGSAATPTPSNSILVMPCNPFDFSSLKDVLLFEDEDAPPTKSSVHDDASSSHSFLFETPNAERRVRSALTPPTAPCVGRSCIVIDRARMVESIVLPVL